MCQFWFWYPATIVQVVLSLDSLPCFCSKTYLYSYKTFFCHSNLWSSSSALLTIWSLANLSNQETAFHQKESCPQLCTKPVFSDCLQKCKSRWAAPPAIPFQDHAFVQGLKHMTSAVWLNTAVENSAQKQLYLSSLLFMEPKKIKSCLCNVTLILLTCYILKTKHNTFEWKVMFQTSCYYSLEFNFCLQYCYVLNFKFYNCFNF